MQLLLGCICKQLSQPDVRAGSSKTFAVGSLGSHRASCEEEKCKTFQKVKDTDLRCCASPRETHPVSGHLGENYTLVFLCLNHIVS